MSRSRGRAPARRVDNTSRHSRFARAILADHDPDCGPLPRAERALGSRAQQGLECRDHRRRVTVYGDDSEERNAEEHLTDRIGVRLFVQLAPLDCAPEDGLQARHHQFGPVSDPAPDVRSSWAAAIMSPAVVAH